MNRWIDQTSEWTLKLDGITEDWSYVIAAVDGRLSVVDEGDVIIGGSRRRGGGRSHHAHQSEAQIQSHQEEDQSAAEAHQRQRQPARAHQRRPNRCNINNNNKVDEWTHATIKYRQISIVLISRRAGMQMSRTGFHGNVHSWLPSFINPPMKDTKKKKMKQQQQQKKKKKKKK